MMLEAFILFYLFDIKFFVLKYNQTDKNSLHRFCRFFLFIKKIVYKPKKMLQIKGFYITKLLNYYIKNFMTNSSI